MAEHELKVWPEYFAPIERGEKTFEFRRDDRTPRFAVGDTLLLREFYPGGINPADSPPCYSLRECTRRVTYVARGGVIPDGFCVMSVVRDSASPDPGERR